MLAIWDFRRHFDVDPEAGPEGVVFARGTPGYSAALFADRYEPALVDDTPLM